MAVRGNIVVTGLKHLDRELMLIAESDGVKGINGAMRKSIRSAIKLIVEPEVRARVPVAKGAHWRDGELVEPGLLERSIRVRAIRRSRTSVGYWCGFADPLFTGDTYYAGLLEYGTKQRSKKSGPSTGMVKPDSFLRVPLYANAERIREHAREGMRVFIAERNRAT